MSRPPLAAGFLAIHLLVGLLFGAGFATGTVQEGWWWLTNTAPPAIEASAPPDVVRGVTRVPVTVAPGARAAVTGARVGGLAVATGSRPGGRPGTESGAVAGVEHGIGLSVAPGSAAGEASISIDTTRLPDGTHLLVIEAQDRSWRRNRGVLEVALRTDNTPPQLAVEPEAPRLRAGHVAAVRLSSDEPAVLGGQWVVASGQEGAEPLPLLEAGPEGNGSARLALLSVPVHAPAGEARLSVTGRDVAGNVGQKEVELTVEATTVPRQALSVPPALAPLATGPVALAEGAQVAALTSAVRPERLWRGEFQLPLAPVFRRTTGFGDRRDYADGHVVYHGGYDIAAPQGTPVRAAAAGIVTFAGDLSQRGTTVIVDHGWGVYSLYAHLSRVDVQPGQPIEQGQTAGAVGSTGLSTGPHLHWEIRLRGMAVDPDSWLALSGTVG